MFKIKDTEERCFYCRGFNMQSRKVRELYLQNDDGEEKKVCLCNNCLREMVKDLHKDGNFTLEIR